MGAETFQFAGFTLDPGRRALLADGVAVALHARAFDILSLLVCHRERVVSREEIVAHVWRGISVGENNLAVQMSSLRRVLSAHPGGDQLILTLAGRGYQFVGDVAETPRAAAVQDQARIAVPVRTGRRGHLVAVATVILVLGAAWAALSWLNRDTGPPRLSIAILPFRSLSADHAQDYLADALSDDLTTDLAHIPESTVIARESADAYKGRAVPVQQIGRALNVRYLVEGSLRAEADQYHINAQLVDAATGGHLWAASFDTSRGRMGDARDAIVRRMASTLDFELTQVEGARSLHDRPRDPDALDLFFRARAILDRDDSAAAMAQAQGLLEKSARLQPDFGDALGQLGALLLRKIHDTDDLDEARDRAEADDSIARALRLAPRNAQALAARALGLSFDGRYAEAESSAQAALAIEPGNVAALVVLANDAQAQGRLDDAVAPTMTILRLNPASPSNKLRYLMLGYIRVLQGKAGDALDLLHQAIAGEGAPSPNAESMGRPEFARLLLVAAYQLEGNADKARQGYDAYKAIWPHRTTWRVAALFAKNTSKLDGFIRLMTALNQAGMPKFAGERDGITPAGAVCVEGEFSETPGILPGGDVLTTTGVAARLRSSPPPLVIDLGRGQGVLPGAAWLDRHSQAESDLEFVDHVVTQRLQGQPEASIVLVGDGPYDCDGYRAARHLIDAGAKGVAWYRGGEENWFAAGLPSTDRRHE